MTWTMNCPLNNFGNVKTFTSSIISPPSCSWDSEKPDAVCHACSCVYSFQPRASGGSRRIWQVRMNTAYKSVIYNTRLITDKNVLLSSGLHHGTICTSPLIGTKSPPHRPWNPLENFRHSNPYFGRIPSPNPRTLDPPVTCTNELRRNHPMRPAGRVPSNFGDHGDQVLWCPPLTFATGWVFPSMGSVAWAA